MNIERKDSGPAYMDKASDAHYSANTMESEFMAAVEKGDANALAPWAPLTNDREKADAAWEILKKGVPPTARYSDVIACYKRQQTIAECMAESLDYGNGQIMAEAMQIILDVASGKDESETARRLLERMAESFAHHNED